MKIVAILVFFYDYSREKGVIEYCMCGSTILKHKYNLKKPTTTFMSFAPPELIPMPFGGSIFKE
jgi:hypothetical protein